MINFKLKIKTLIITFLLAAILLVACEADKVIPTTVSIKPEISTTQVTKPTADLSSSLGEFTTPSQYRFEKLPQLYLTVDPVIPPFYSKLYTFSPEIIFDHLSTQKTSLVSDDYQFLERDPNLTWSSDYEKAIFVNMEGVHLFNPDSNQFDILYSDSFVHLPIFWDSDNLQIIYTVDNGRAFSGDVYLLNSETKDGKRFEFPENMMPAILGWIDEQTILLFLNESGLKPDSQKMELINRRLYTMNVKDGILTEVSLSSDWLHTEEWRLSPDGKNLFYRTYPNAPDSYEEKRANLLDLQTNSVEILDLPEGDFKWLPNSQGFLLIDDGFDNPANIIWYMNWIPMQAFNFEEGSAISSLLITPDSDGAVVFLTNSFGYQFGSEQPYGYKAFFITNDGGQDNFLIPGLNSEDWKVVFTSWGK